MESQRVGHDWTTNTSLHQWVRWPGSQCHFLRASVLQTFRAWCPLLLAVLKEQLREGASVSCQMLAGACHAFILTSLFLTHVLSLAPGSGSRKSEGCCPKTPPAIPTCLEVGRPSGTSPKLGLGRPELYWPTILVYWSTVWPWIGFSPFLSLISLAVKSEGHTGSPLAGSSHFKILPLTPTHSLICHCVFYCCVVQSLSCVQLFVTPWAVAHQVSLSFTISQSLLKLMSIELVTLSNYLILCLTLLLLPSISPSIKVFYSKSALHIRCP